MFGKRVAGKHKTVPFKGGLPIEKKVTGVELGGGQRNHRREKKKGNGERTLSQGEHAKNSPRQCNVKSSMPEPPDDGNRRELLETQKGMWVVCHLGKRGRNGSRRKRQQKKVNQGQRG